MDNSYNSYQYGQDMYNTQQKNESKALAIVGLVISIIAFIFCLCYCAALPLGIAGIIIAIIVLAKKKAGKGMAIASLIMSGIAVLVSTLIIGAVGSLSDNFMDFYADLPEIVENYKEDGSVPDYMEDIKEKYPDYVDAFMQGVIQEYDKDPEKYKQAADQIKESQNNKKN